MNHYKTKADNLFLRDEHNKNKSHYQTFNIISLYLFLRYPDKYYIRIVLVKIFTCKKSSTRVHF